MSCVYRANLDAVAYKIVHEDVVPRAPPKHVRDKMAPKGLLPDQIRAITDPEAVSEDAYHYTLKVRSSSMRSAKALVEWRAFLLSRTGAIYLTSLLMRDDVHLHVDISNKRVLQWVLFLRAALMQLGTADYAKTTYYIEGPLAGWVCLEILMNLYLNRGIRSPRVPGKRKAKNDDDDEDDEDGEDNPEDDA